MPVKTTDLSEEERLFIANLRLQRQQNGLNNPSTLGGNVQKGPSVRKKKVSFAAAPDELALSPLAEEDEY